MLPTTLLALAALLPDATSITRRSVIRGAATAALPLPPLCGAATAALPLPALAANDAIEANQLNIAKRRYALGRPYAPKLSPDELEGLERLQVAERCRQSRNPRDHDAVVVDIELEGLQLLQATELRC